MSEENEGAALGADDAPKLTEVETLASDMGWKPKDQFQGPEDAWKPAAEFIKADRGRRDDKREIKRLREQSERTATAVSKMLDSALKEQEKEIVARYEIAVEDKDKVGAAKAIRDLDALQEQKKERAKEGTTDYEADFASDNPWYGKSKGATAWAKLRSAELGEQNIKPEKQLEMIAKEVREEFPELFEEKGAETGKKPPLVAAPSRGGSNAAPEGFGSLPQDVKKSCDSMANAAYERFGKGADRDKYMADYRNRFAKTYYADKVA